MALLSSFWRDQRKKQPTQQVPEDLYTDGPGWLSSFWRDQRKKQPTQQVPEDLHTDVYGNETRTLLGTDAAFQRPWHKDKRLWVRWPAQIWRATGQRFVPKVRLVRIWQSLFVTL